jgi:hypothetical protein
MLDQGLMHRARGLCGVARGVTHSEYGVCALAGTVESCDGGLWEIDGGLCERDVMLSLCSRATPAVVPGTRPTSGGTGVGVGRLPQDLSQMGPYLSQNRPNGGCSTGWRFVRMVGACPKRGGGACEDSASVLAV